MTVYVVDVAMVQRSPSKRDDISVSEVFFQYTLQLLAWNDKLACEPVMPCVARPRQRYQSCGVGQPTFNRIPSPGSGGG